MKFKVIISAFLILLVTILSCNKKNNIDSDKTFETYKNTFVKNLWITYPEWASSQGFHKFDSVLKIPNDAYRKEQLQFSNSNLDSLKKFDLENLSDNNKTDYQMIKNQLESIIFDVNEMKSYQWNPALYNVSGSFAEILNGDYEPLENRLKNFSLKMNNVAKYYAAAKTNLKNPTLEHLDLAVSQNNGGLSVFKDDLKKAVFKSKLSQLEKKQILEKAETTCLIIGSYADYLLKIQNKTPRSFRLGKDLYVKKFNFDLQSGYTADEIYQKAIDHKKELHQKMFELANRILKYNPKNEPTETEKLAIIKQVIDKISLQHTTPEKFQSEIEKQIPELTAYVKEKNLLYIDPSKPLVVRKEPDYMAGVAGASISSPGPYDKNANTYYNVGSLSGWDKEKSESYLREYNNYILQILNIHEAIPGHYTQLVYSNQSPSIIKSILGNGATIEGWAVYGERMMLESGYKNSDQMWLMYYKWNLRTTCNTILDYSVHTKNMSKEAALHLLIDEAFQQQAEADGKWKRVSLSQVQLCSYFTGYTEIYDFREQLKKEQGEKFNLKQFHEKFLSFGSAPVKYIKQLMTNKKQ